MPIPHPTIVLDVASYTLYSTAHKRVIEAYRASKILEYLVALDRLHSEYNIVQGLHIISTWDTVSKGLVPFRNSTKP